MTTEDNIGLIDEPLYSISLENANLGWKHKRHSGGWYTYELGKYILLFHQDGTYFEILTQPVSISFSPKTIYKQGDRNHGMLKVGDVIRAMDELGIEKYNTYNEQQNRYV